MSQQSNMTQDTKNQDQVWGFMDIFHKRFIQVDKQEFMRTVAQIINDRQTQIMYEYCDKVPQQRTGFFDPQAKLFYVFNQCKYQRLMDSLFQYSQKYFPVMDNEHRAKQIANRFNLNSRRNKDK